MMPQTDVRERPGVRLSPDMAKMLGASGAFVAVAALGSAIVAVLPEPSALQVAAAYLAPASLAFVAYWWVAQKE